MKNNKGFTLTEIVVVIAIIGVLAVALVPKISNFSDSAKDKGIVVEFESIKKNLDFYKITNKKLPNVSEFNTLLEGDYEFEIKSALIKEDEDLSDNIKNLAIRTESTEMSIYNEPIGSTFVIKYNTAEDDLFGKYDSGSGKVDLVGAKTYLESIESENVEVIILDSLASNVPEVIYFK